MLKDIRKSASEIYRKSRYYNWLICVLVGIIIAGVTALTPMLGILSVFLVLIIAIPFFFAGLMLTFNLSKHNIPLTFKSLSASFLLYFTPHFKSTFQFWKSFGTSLIILIVSLIIFGCSGYAIINNIYPGSLVSFTDELAELIKSSKFSIENFNLLVEQYSYALNPFSSIMMLPSIGLTALSGIFFAGFNAFRFYFKVTHPIVIGNTGDVLCSITYKENRGSYLRDFFSLNWPLFVLFIVGYSLAGGLFTFYTPNTDYLGAFALFIGFASMITFLPFYFANMEAIYFAHISDYEQTVTRMKEKTEEDLNKTIETHYENNAEKDNN